MRVARVCARHAVVCAFVFLALTPMSALAFTPPAPGNPGNHIGEFLHNPHLQTPQVGGVAPLIPPASQLGTDSAGSESSASFPSITLPSLDLQRSGGAALAALTPGSNHWQDSLLVVVILAALIAANVVLGVLYAARGGNFLVRRTLRVAPATA